MSEESALSELSDQEYVYTTKAPDMKRGNHHHRTKVYDKNELARTLIANEKQPGKVVDLKQSNVVIPGWTRTTKLPLQNSLFGHVESARSSFAAESKYDQSLMSKTHCVIPK